MLHRPFAPAVIYANFQHTSYATFADWQQEALAATHRLALWVAQHPNPGKGETLPVENELYRALKECLKDYFHGKCAYCESEFESVAWGDVEHYRPKRKVTGEVHPGYHWLAYEPSNLMPSCQRCNQGDAKVNKFPLAAGGRRALTEADNLGAEAPLLLNPYDSSHCGWSAHHLKFVFERDGWELLATGRVEGLTPEGKESVDTYKLNRPPLVKRRRKNQIAAIKALRATYDTATFEQEWDDLFAFDQEHAVAVRATCEAWLQLQEERLLVAARRARGPSTQ